MAEVYFKLGNLEKQEEINTKLVELGKAPITMTVQRAIGHGKAGNPERGLEILEQALADPEGMANPTVLRTYAGLLLELGRCEEALANFEGQAQVELMMTEGSPDAFLDINRARCFACMGEWQQALATLDELEARLPMYDDTPELQRQLHGSVLRRRAQILLEPGTPIYDPARALLDTQQGLDVTGRNRPRMFDLEIEALVASDDLAGAIERANEAATLLFALKHYSVVISALEQATSGDRPGAAARLRAFKAQPEDLSAPESMERIAGHL
jgi:tetratricopeptide (TPR) repeat protein